MKFGQSLERDMVPEWRGQYLEYKKGKKKIKKLRKRQSVLDAARASKKRSLTPSLRGLLRPEPALQASPDAIMANGMRSQSISSVHVGQSTPKTPAWTKKAYRSAERDEFALPSPAIDPSSYNMSSGSRDSISVESTLNASREGDGPRLANQSTPLLNENDAPRRLVRKQSTISKIFDNLRRSNSLGQIFGNPHIGEPGTGDGRSETELEDMSTYAKQQFIRWVDSELEKVNSFYRQREQDCLQRFLILQDQLVQLSEQREAMRARWERGMQETSDTSRDDAVDKSVSGALRHRRPGGEREGYGPENGSVGSGGSVRCKDGVRQGRVRRKLRRWGVILDKQLEVFSKFEYPSLPTFDWARANGKAEKQYYEAGYGDEGSEEGEESENEEGEGSENVENEDGESEDEEWNESEDSDSDGEPQVFAGFDPGTRRKTQKPRRRQYDPRFNRRDYGRKKQQSVQAVHAIQAGQHKTTLYKSAPHKVAYFIARRQLKKAVYEFYRSLELLKSYRMMNRTGFRKLIKKYDKAVGDTLLPGYMQKVDGEYFTTSGVLDDLVTQVETMFARYFERGNRKIAVTKLRAIEQQKTYYGAQFLDGWLLGLALPVFFYTVFRALHRTLSGDLPEGKWLMQIWAGFFLLCLMAMLFGVNCLVWDRYRVNYKLIFEFSPRDNLHYRQYLVLPMLMFLVGSCTAWLSFMDFWPAAFNGRDWPWVFVLFALAVLLCPFDIFFLDARKWLLSTVFRLCLSGFYPVEFRDFFLGDIFCSLTYSISNTSMFFCLYDTHWNKCLDGSNGTRCGSSGSHLFGFLAALPNIWRFLQCFRRFADTGDRFPHLANMCKYFISCMYYMSLSLYRMNTNAQNRALLIVFGSMNGLVSAAWDLLMDWSLFQFHSINFLLRDELTYKRKSVYYTAMVIDVVLRHQWVCYALFTRHIQQSAITGFAVAVAEIIRRFNWIFFRMENEHATNVHLFRASRDAPLPYPTSQRRHTRDANSNFVAAVVPPPEEQTPLLRDDSSSASIDSSAQVDRPDRSYLRQLSRILTTAHIKDFQRRKPRADSAAAASLSSETGDSADDGDDTDEDIAEERMQQ
ncbi:hypothetical protein BRETT_005187 [Brettanomyces bruxellensis]|uniref:Signal transduction protein n=1 Tax=Dekkera bruxellensis TaxID=5007 RepID=A0A871QY59_DEKBR|nr:uncharacterized protein BRETT_005187 [Brettanomyces bruxellensis]QOU18127.1 hypothetical protein BRETT_005187 [Brettanomyces bruxellensis]